MGIIRTKREHCMTSPTRTTENISSFDLMDPVLFSSDSARGRYRISSQKDGEESNRTGPQPQKLEAFSKAKTLPVLGRAQGGSEGNLVIEDNPIDWTFRPADLQGVNDAFSVFVSGDSMLPKYKNGDLAYVHPGKMLRKNRFVLVETVEHKGFIKQFVGWSDDKLIVRQFNPAKDIVIEKEKILRVMMVIGSLDS